MGGRRHLSRARPYSPTRSQGTQTQSDCCRPLIQRPAVLYRGRRRKSSPKWGSAHLATREAAMAAFAKRLAALSNAQARIGRNGRGPRAACPKGTPGETWGGGRPLGLGGGSYALVTNSASFLRA